MHSGKPLLSFGSLYFRARVGGIGCTYSTGPGRSGRNWTSYPCRSTSGVSAAASGFSLGATPEPPPPWRSPPPRARRTARCGHSGNSGHFSPRTPGGTRAGPWGSGRGGETGRDGAVGAPPTYPFSPHLPSLGFLSLSSSPHSTPLPPPGHFPQPRAANEETKQSQDLGHSSCSHSGARSLKS